MAYFQKGEESRSDLDIPTIPENLKYKGPMVILVNGESGSAAELFTGAMQFKHRAMVMGTNTAGKVMLKSMFNFDDTSMVVLVTSVGYYPDGRMYSFKGVVPDKYVNTADKQELLILAAGYLLTQSKNNP